ncbi:IS1 family transposase [Plesiomonas shigelloides]|uniref:IS1 family transposase n=1 Tax=Plesiomonas shigelloides TaxID=703 RepID=UPI0039B0FE92
MRKRVLADVFGHRNALTLQRRLALLRQFNIVFIHDGCLTDISDAAGFNPPCKYIQRIEKPRLNLRSHLKLFTERIICRS